MISENRNIVELKKLFDEFYTAVLAYSITIVKNKDDAEDIVQQAFISLWQKMNTIDFNISARSYLYKTVYHGGLDFLKHKKAVQRYGNDTMKNSVESMRSAPGEGKELQKKLLSAISQLPEQCARIFTMSRFDGLKYREIAASLKISEKTVENQMGKALKSLREAFKEYLPLILLLINYWVW